MKEIIPTRPYRTLYLFILHAVVFFLPLSMYFLSVSTLLLALLWLLDFDWRKKWTRLKRNPVLILFIGIYILGIIGLWNTGNLLRALHDLRIKLPLLAFPLILGTGEPLKRSEIKSLFFFFSLSLVLVTFLGILYYYILPGRALGDARHLSLFISHIRLALMIDLSVAAAIIFLMDPLCSLNRAEKVYFVLSSVFLSFFLVLMLSLTGLTIMIIVLTAGFWRYRSFFTPWFRYTFFTGLILVLGLFIVFTGIEWMKFVPEKTPDLSELEEETPDGGKYFHYPEIGFMENGNYIWLYVCPPELEAEWSKRSAMEYRGKDLQGNNLDVTLIRYLTAKGLKKDGASVRMLSEQDIMRIEEGIANPFFTEAHPVRVRLYKIIWQTDRYLKGGNPSGHSITQRLEYLKTAMHIARDNFWTGVGTGDVPDAFGEQYKKERSPLDKEWRLRTHNQYITVLVTHGIFGLLYFLFAFFYPAVGTSVSRRPLFIFFLLIAALSMLHEDTLETHTGVSFVGVFYAILYFAGRKGE